MLSSATTKVAFKQSMYMAVSELSPTTATRAADQVMWDFVIMCIQEHSECSVNNTAGKRHYAEVHKCCSDVDQDGGCLLAR